MTALKYIGPTPAVSLVLCLGYYARYSKQCTSSRGLRFAFEVQGKQYLLGGQHKQPGAWSCCILPQYAVCVLNKSTIRCIVVPCVYDVILAKRTQKDTHVCGVQPALGCARQRCCPSLAAAMIAQTHRHGWGLRAAVSPTSSCQHRLGYSSSSLAVGVPKHAAPRDARPTLYRQPLVLQLQYRSHCCCSSRAAPQHHG